MARGLEVGETVYVPRAKLGLSLDAASAFQRTKVVERAGRSVRVDLPAGKVSDWVSAAFAHRNIGVYLVRAGDFTTELSLLDPLTKSIYHYLHLLLPDDMVRVRYVRSRKELQRFWKKEHGAFSHVVLVGHGRSSGVRFGLGGWTSGDELAEFFDAENCMPKNYISLCCNTGYAEFARLFSAAEHCSTLLAPFHDLHGAIASQYCQTILAYHLLHGETVNVAHRHARESVPGGSIFRLWTNGSLS